MEARTTTTTTTTRSVSDKRSVTKITSVSQIVYKPVISIQDADDQETFQQRSISRMNTPLPHVDLEELSVTHTFATKQFPHIHFFALDGSDDNDAAGASLAEKIQSGLGQEIIEDFTSKVQQHKSIQASANLGALYQVLEEFDKAEQILLETLELAIQQLGGADPITLTIFTNAGFLKEMQGKYVEAESIYARRVNETKETFGDYHVKTLEALSDLGIAYRLQKKNDRALHLHRRCTEISIVVFGEDHAHTSYFKHCLEELEVLHTA
ncbi:UNVERIFIED_CONTAM: hypothetical protein HDU68_003515 [Siphonaria sp. JEL0065]|nr:hypothetical protein HDU68_003515 [Siphonaria sp. JEL0065]